jgi:hypothetical protein
MTVFDLVLVVYTAKRSSTLHFSFGNKGNGQIVLHNAILGEIGESRFLPQKKGMGTGKF